jgi:hypothetical protein
VAIKSFQQGPSAIERLLESVPARAAIGYATGGPVGAAMGVVSAKNPSLGRAANAAVTIAGKNGPGPAPDPSTANQLKMPAIGDSFRHEQESSVSRRLSALNADPNHAVEDGLAALRDPSVPQELRDLYAEPLLRAKHFGIRAGQSRIG